MNSSKRPEGAEDDDAAASDGSRRMAIVAIPDGFLVAFEHSKHAWTIRVAYNEHLQVIYKCELRNPVDGTIVTAVNSEWNKNPTGALVHTINAYNKFCSSLPSFKPLATRGPNGAVMVGLTYSNIQARLCMYFKQRVPSISDLMTGWFSQSFEFGDPQTQHTTKSDSPPPPPPPPPPVTPPSSSLFSSLASSGDKTATTSSKRRATITEEDVPIGGVSSKRVEVDSMFKNPLDKLESLMTVVAAQWEEAKSGELEM